MNLSEEIKRRPDDLLPEALNPDIAACILKNHSPKSVVASL